MAFTLLLDPVNRPALRHSGQAPAAKGVSMSTIKAAYHTLLKRWHTLTGYKIFLAGFHDCGSCILYCRLDTFDFLDLYLQLILIYVGINIILTVSLNLINGYMGEFSVGHAGFMAVGAYIASLLTVHVFPPGAQNFFFLWRYWPAVLARRWSAFWWQFPLLKHAAIIWPLSRWPSA
ncbi:MAG: hypothetical protein MZV70_32325 [Desulfobacterales bacterium]|nr:hypothetical protein [Desulfobacterales bacterium]